MSRSSQNQEEVWFCKIFDGDLATISDDDLSKEFFSLNGYELLAIRFFIKSTGLKNFVESGIDSSQYKEASREAKEIRRKLFSNEKIVKNCEDFVKLSCAKLFLSSLYESKSILGGYLSHIYPEICDKLLEESQYSQSGSAKIIRDVIGIIKNKRFKNEKMELQIIPHHIAEGGYQHLVYFVIQKQEGKQALYLVDGNGAMLQDRKDPRRNVAACIKVDVGDVKIDNFNQQKPKSKYFDGPRKFLEDIVFKYSENPIYEEMISAKRQLRGNCSLKSFHVLMRLILEEVFEKTNDRQNPGGEGHALYKEWKNAIAQNAQKTVLEQEGDESKFLQTIVFPKRQIKLERASRVVDVGAEVSNDGAGAAQVARS